MANKKQNHKKVTDKVTEAAANAGLIMMTAAATLGLSELPHGVNEKHAIVPHQPVFAVADTGPEPARHEKEEVHPHSGGFSVSQRTASRAGRA